MNEFEVPSAKQLDRFVDGELPEAERREVLVALDREDCDEACGWRRLALAFVESQTLQRELAVTCLPKSSDALNTDRCVLSARRLQSEASHVRTTSKTVAKWLRLMAVAACALFAFGLGRWSSPSGRELAGVENSPSPTPKTFVEGPATVGPSRESSTELAAADSGQPEVQQTLRLVLDNPQGGPPQTVDVPVVSDSSINPIEWLDSPPSIPADVRRALLRNGRVVHEQRQLYEVEMTDGRRGIVPISDVTVIHAGLDVYQ